MKLSLSKYDILLHDWRLCRNLTQQRQVHKYKTQYKVCESCLKLWVHVWFIAVSVLDEPNLNSENGM